MTRLSTPFVTLILALALAAPACGGGGDDDAPTIDSFFPADNEISGWVEDTAVGGAGVDVANNEAEAVALINGDAEPFQAHGFVQFAWQHYVNDSYNLEVRIWGMGTATVAQTLYTDLLTDAATYSAQSWENLTLGADSRIADTGASWWINVLAGAYHVEVKINQTAANDTTSRGHAEAFATEIVSRIP